MKQYLIIHGCGQPYVFCLFIPRQSDEFTYIFIITMNLSTWSFVVWSNKRSWWSNTRSHQCFCTVIHALWKKIQNHFTTLDGKRMEIQGKKVNASKTEEPYPFSSMIHHASIINPKPVVHQFSHIVHLNFITSSIQYHKSHRDYSSALLPYQLILNEV